MVLGVLLSVLMLVCFLFSLAMLIYKIYTGKILAIIWFAFGTYTSFIMLGEFTTATIQFAMKGI